MPAAPGGGLRAAGLKGGAAMAKVLVTGGSGVLGRALAPLLHSEGHDVTVLTRRPDAQLPGGVRRIVGDLASGAGLDAAVRDAGVVVHLATSPFRPGRVGAGFRAGHHLAASTPR